MITQAEKSDESEGLPTYAFAAIAGGFTSSWIIKSIKFLFLENFKINLEILSIKKSPPAIICRWAFSWSFYSLRASRAMRRKLKLRRWKCVIKFFQLPMFDWKFSYSQQFADDQGMVPSSKKEWRSINIYRENDLSIFSDIIINTHITSTEWMSLGFCDFRKIGNDI